jgi:hypothetical protein
MKIKPNDLKLLAEAIAKVKEANPDATLQAYIDNKAVRYARPLSCRLVTVGDVKMRWRWDVFWAAGRYLPDGFLGPRGLYSYLNDSNIDTALRFVLKDDLASAN